MGYAARKRRLMNDLQKYSPQQLTTIEKVLAVKPASLAKIRAEDSTTAMQRIVKAIKHLQSQFNFDKVMNQDQILNCAMVILKRFADLSPEDLTLCFEMGVAGEFKDRPTEKILYHKLDVTDICGWLDIYRSRKADKAKIQRTMTDEESQEMYKRSVYSKADEVSRAKSLAEIYEKSNPLSEKNKHQPR